MNKPNLLLCLLIGTLQAIAAEPAPSVAPASATATVTVQEAPGPHIAFDQTSYDFGKVESGELIKHTFYFTNTGNELLEVRDVRPSCGCTTAGAWDKQVEPGKSGSIPVQFNSIGYGGAVHKLVTVICNDPVNSNAVLNVTGTVWKPIDVLPAFASFNLGPDVQVQDKRVLRITSNINEPLTLSEPQCTNPAFKPDLKTIKEGKEFELTITVVPPLTVASVSAPITMKTSYPKLQVLTVTAFAVVQAPITTIPVQLALPVAPLTNSVSLTATIQNNSTNTLVLSEPKASLEGIEVKLKEVQPGKRFELTAVFPADFQHPIGPPVEVSAKSNFPLKPLVTIPVYQAAAPPKPVAPPAPTPAAHTAATASPPQALPIAAGK
jgi:hypothetical protein